MTAQVALHANFRMTGWRWPFRLGDALEVWRDNELVGEISVELLASLVVHYLVGHDLVQRFDAAIIPTAAELVDPRRLVQSNHVTLKRPLVKLAPRVRVQDRDYRAELRARRRARKRTS
jgi:hypothetical protein